MAKKKITVDICVSQPVIFKRVFPITKEIEVDEDWKKEEGWSDEEYAEENFSSEFEVEAKKLMEKEMDKEDIFDADYEPLEFEWDY